MDRRKVNRMSDKLIAVKTLPAMLAERAEHSGTHQWLTLYSKDRIVSTIGFGELMECALSWANFLHQAGVQPRDRVMLVLPTERAFFEAFWGILLVGAVPVPVYPPAHMNRMDVYLQRIQGVANNCTASALITNSLLAPLLRPLQSLPGVNLRAFITKKPSATGIGSTPKIAHHASDLALLQYTSGSTGQQKGVMLTHANLLANLRDISNALRCRPDDIAVSWLPLYHDMGLIGLMMGSLYLGVPLVAMSPIDFLRKPVRWIRLMSEYHATFTAAPNFAFSLVARKVRESDLESIDLSAWRIALCGAEPIQPATIENFTRRFGPLGFREESFFPAYGLAENTLAASFSTLGTCPTVKSFDSRLLEEEGRAVPCINQHQTRTMVSVGRPLAGLEVGIMSSTGILLEEGLQGEIVLRGPSVMQGYYNNPEATARAYRSGWLRTGDIGFVLDGQLYVSGRLKDMIIKAGRNYFAEDLEASVAALPGVRPGGVCAFAVNDPVRGTEKLVLLVEATGPKNEDNLTALLRKTMTEATGCRPDEIVLLAPRTLPKTSSGKLQRFQARRLYLNQSLQSQHREGKFRTLCLYTQAVLKDRFSSVEINSPTEELVGSDHCKGN